MIRTIKSSSIGLLAAMLGAEVRAFEHGLEENRRMEPRAEKPEPAPLPDYRRIQAAAETKPRTLAMADIDRLQAAQAKRNKKALRRMARKENKGVQFWIDESAHLPPEAEMQDDIRASGV